MVLQHPSGGLKSAAFTSVLWSLTQAWGVSVITLVQSVVIARLLEPSDYGIVAFAGALIGCVSALVDQGMTTIIEASAQHDEATLDSAWWATVVVSLLVCGGIFATTPALAHWTGNAYLGALLPVFSITVVLSALSAVQLALLKARFLHRSVALAYLVGTALGAVAGIACAIAGLAYWSLVAKALVEGALISALLVYLSPWKPRLRFNAAAWRGLLSRSAPVVGMRLLDIANNRVDSLLIGSRLGIGALGFYATGQRIYWIAVEAVQSAVNQVLLPVFSRFSAQPGRSAEVLLRLVACTSLLTFPAFALLAATGPDLVAVILGEKWRAAGPVLSVFALGGILFSVSHFNAPLLVVSGRANQVFWLSLLNTAGNAIGFIVAVPFGATAVAAAFVIRGYLVFPVSIWLMRRACGLSVRRYSRTLWPASAASALAALGAWACGTALAHWPAAGRLPLALAAGLGLYALAVATVFRNDARSAIAELRSMVAAARAAVPSKKLEPFE